LDNNKALLFIEDSYLKNKKVKAVQ